MSHCLPRLFVLVCLGVGAADSKLLHAAAPKGSHGRAQCAHGSSFERRHGGLDHDPAGNARLRSVGAQIARQVAEPCRFHLLNTSARNAFSFSCGCIYITAGLYRELRSDDLLAAVLAHELAHVAAQDGKRPCSGSDCQLDREKCADQKAVTYLRRVGRDPRSLLTLIDLLRTEQPAGWSDSRLAALEQNVRSSSVVPAGTRVTHPTAAARPPVIHQAAAAQPVAAIRPSVTVQVAARSY